MLPPGFTFPRLSELYPMTIAGTEQPQIWKPFGATLADKDPRGGFNNACIARLAPGVSQAQALSALNALQAALPKDIDAMDLRAALVPLQDQITGRSSPDPRPTPARHRLAASARCSSISKSA